jgi:hypothetical protein
MVLLRLTVASCARGLTWPRDICNLEVRHICLEMLGVRWYVGVLCGGELQHIFIHQIDDPGCGNSLIVQGWQPCCAGFQNKCRKRNGRGTSHSGAECEAQHAEPERGVGATVAGYGL